MLDVTEDLPKRMKKHGCKLHMQTDGYTNKFVLTNPNLEYRGFIYKRGVYSRDTDTSLSDLFSNFYYVTGLAKVEAKYG